MNQKQKMKKPFPLFWMIYGVVLILFALLLFKGMGILKEYLTAFENSQPILRAEETFQTYFAGDDFVSALEKAEYQPGEFESLQAASDQICRMKEGKKITYYAAMSTESEVQYNVVLVEEGEDSEENLAQTSEDKTPSVQSIPSTKIATVSFVKSETEDQWGLRGYEFSNMEIFLEAKESVRVTVPSTSRLTVNGKEVDSRYAVEESQHEFNAFLPDGVTGITLVTYEIPGLFQEPQLSLTDKDSLPQTLQKDEQTGDYTALLNYSAEWKQAHSDRILAGMKEYAKYMQNDGRIGLVSQYFDTSSMFYRNIAYNLSQFVWDHNGYEFQNEKIDDFYAFDENTFCCHVSFDHVLHLYGREDYVDVLDMIVFAKKKGNNFYIYDRIVQ